MLMDAVFEYQESGKVIEMDLPTELVFLRLKSYWKTKKSKEAVYEKTN
jgi:hypothetical protein